MKCVTSFTNSTKDGTIQVEHWEKANIFKRFYFELATDLVKKLPIAPNQFSSNSTKIAVFNNK